MGRPHGQHARYPWMFVLVSIARDNTAGARTHVRRRSVALPAPAATPQLFFGLPGPGGQGFRLHPIGRWPLNQLILLGNCCTRFSKFSPFVRLGLSAEVGSLVPERDIGGP